MARTEARLLTSIWEDEDFIDLSPGGQWLYMLVLSQSDLAHDGVIGLRPSRWAKRARNATAEDVHSAIDELHQRGFVVADHDEGELLIRSFIRRDKVYRQPNILRAAADHLRLVTSPTILATLAAELARIAELPDVTKDALAIVAEMQDTLLKRGAPNPSGNPPPNPSRKGSDMPTSNPSKGSGNPSEMPTPGTPGERGRTDQYTYEDQIFPGPLAPDPVPPAPRAADATPTQRSKAITDAYAVVQPLLKWPSINAIVLKAIKAERWTDQQIHAAMMRLAGANRGVTVETLRYELTGPPSARAAPLALVERNGMQLKPETAARLDDRQKWRDRDAASQRLALGGAS
jgi:hypothetical protein